MDGILNSRCIDCRYRGRHIYVIGAFRFERELLLSYVRPRTAAEWFTVETLAEVPVSNHDVPLGKKLLLLDANAMSREELEGLFSSREWKAHVGNLLALFNLQRQLEIEKLALKSGVRGFLYADDHAEDLVNGICAINSGELWISRHIIAECLLSSYVEQPTTQPAAHELSKREIELLRTLQAGASNDAIADRMCISSHTVKTHLHNIFRKLKVNSRLEAALWAKENL